MCGITGYAYAISNRPADRDVLRTMTDRLRHRGPDGEGYHTGSGIGLGVRRLSIIDVETGDQPISNEDGSVVVVCDGEIYNYVELRRELQARGHVFRSQSDTEVIVHLYEDLGERCLERLRGMFALAVWDSDAKELLLARDRFGIKPLYYALGGDAIYFGSEQKAILAADVVTKEMDLRGLNDLLTMGFVVAPSTLFAAVRQLSPGSFLLYREGEHSTNTFWDAVFPRHGEEPEERTEEEWATALLEKLDETVRIHLRSDVPVGAWLSPGIDSSAIVALMAKHRTEPIRTMTLGFENPDFDEVRGQRTLADFAEYDLVSRIASCGATDFERFAESIRHAEDPSLTGLEIPRQILAEATSRDVKVVLTGEGSDEILAGYKRFRLDKLLRPLAWLPTSLRRPMLLGDTFPKRWPRASSMLIAPRRIRLPRYASTLGGPSEAGLDHLLSADVKAELARGDVVWDLNLPADFDRWHPLSRLQYYEIKVRLPSLVLHTLDRGSMAHSVEARVPFLDHELFELTAGMPPRLKLRGFREKHVLREAVRLLLPPEIVTRKKRGLSSPIHQWLRGPLPTFAHDLLSDASLRRTGIFEPAGVSRLLDEHRRGRRNWSTELLAVLALQVWDGLFVSGSL